MKLIKLILLIVMITIMSCNSKKNKVIADLNESDIEFLSTEIQKMLDEDQRYRKILSLGTLNDSLLVLGDSLSKTATLEDYVAFTQSIPKTLTKQQNDSLWRIQHQIDSENYLNLKEIITKYGYPSKERLGKDLDLFPILVHPPVEITPQEYLNEMITLLKPEVVEKRMNGKLFAMLYDNIKHKILKEPQFYGTGQEFNPKTMTLGNPTIANIEETNKAREEIGLPALKEGEYNLVE
jgi:hypothetical protein